jgi:YHS domain-containing protein
MKDPSLRRKVNMRDEPEELVQDPYCRTYIPKRSAVKKRIAGKDCYFCNPDCLRKYLEKS